MVYYFSHSLVHSDWPINWKWSTVCSFVFLLCSLRYLNIHTLLLKEDRNHHRLTDPQVPIFFLFSPFLWLAWSNRYISSSQCVLQCMFLLRYKVNFWSLTNFFFFNILKEPCGRLLYTHWTPSPSHATSASTGIHRVSCQMFDQPQVPTDDVEQAMSS